MTDPPQALLLAAALACGLMIGIERGWRLRGERPGSRVAGVRTFTLISTAGGLSAVIGSRLGAPIAAILVLATSAGIVLGYWRNPARRDATGFVSAMVALSTVALYASYAMPIAAGVRARRSGRWRERGPWHLGRWSTLVNVVALTWVALITVLFVLPPNELVGYTFFGCLCLLALMWFGTMRSSFRGPPAIRVGRQGPTSD